MYEYEAVCIKVVDGDTIHVEIDLGIDVQVNQTIRFYGINTPELPTPEGVKAKVFVQDWMKAQNNLIVIKTIKDRREKYGRYLGMVWNRAETECLNNLLLNEGLAVEYMI